MTASRTLRTRVSCHPATPPLLVVGGLTSLEMGAAVAKLLFPLAGVAGVIALRLGFAAVALILFWRPRLRRGRILWFSVLGGTLLAIHHLAFYGAVNLLPLGIAVTLEFTGPLAVALFTTRRPVGVLWAILAALGVALTAGINLGEELAGVGISLALIAGATWAVYILLSSHLGARTSDGHWLAIAATWATVIVLPIGIGSAGARLLDWRVLLGGLLVALLCEALSYSMQNAAIRRMPAQAFSILVSLEPAVAAALGLVILHQVVTRWQLVGIAAIITASMANTLMPSHHSRLAEDPPTSRGMPRDPGSC